MIEVRCPRCEQYWYSEADEGKVRLCPACADMLRAEARLSGKGPRPELGAFFYYVLGMALGVMLLMGLAALWPKVFGWPLLAIGTMLALGGAHFWSGYLRGIGTEGDWTAGRWFFIAMVAGICCVIFFFSRIRSEVWRTKGESPSHSLTKPVRP